MTASGRMAVPARITPRAARPHTAIRPLGGIERRFTDPVPEGEGWNLCACGANGEYGHPWGGWGNFDNGGHRWCRGLAWEFPTNAEAFRVGVSAFADGDDELAFRLLGWRRGTDGNIRIPV